jgi:hypothetical protein
LLKGETSWQFLLHLSPKPRTEPLEAIADFASFRSRPTVLCFGRGFFLRDAIVLLTFGGGDGRRRLGEGDAIQAKLAIDKRSF